jgi:hypothetical protein
MDLAVVVPVRVRNTQAARGRGLLAVVAAEIDDGLVRDMTAMCASLRGKRVAGSRALVAGAATGERVAA